MWDERFSSDDYAYGKEPNDFLVEWAHSLPLGRVLSLAEGEGRNAVFLATQGRQVTAMDSSKVGLEKARRLAAERGVQLDTLHAELETLEPGIQQWDAVVSIFAPLAHAERRILHRKVVAALKPGGVFLLEAYTPAQLAYGTGGGSDPDTKITADLLREELDGLQFLHLVEIEREVLEGRYHTGRSAVLQAVAQKPAAG